MRLWIRRKFHAHLVKILTGKTGSYEQRSWLDVRALERTIRKGDVLLVEGDQRVSVAIKYLTQSTWSHAGVYIGDELLRRGGEAKEMALREFGDQADSLLVEALMEGVVLSPLSKYHGFNIRLCRPHSIRSGHLQRVLDEAIDAVGLHYDLGNVLNLLFYFLPIEFFRRRFSKSTERYLPAELPTEVICTSLIGHLFQRVSFPVLPQVTFPDRSPAESYSPRSWFTRAARRREPRYSALYHDRDPRMLAPRDFDLSPYFEIVKFNVIEKGSFDYTRIQWLDPTLEEESDEERDSA